MEGANSTTGDKIVIEFTRGTTPVGKIVGKCHNKQGKRMYEITGHWSDKMYIKNCLTGDSECVYTFPEMIENGARQFSFSKDTVLLNYLPE